MPKFEKVNDSKMKVTREVSKIINVPDLVKAKKDLETQIKVYQEQLKEVNKALTEAEKLGIDVSGKPKPTPKPSKGKPTT